MTDTTSLHTVTQWLVDSGALASWPRTRSAVFLAIARKTAGWHKPADRISLTQLSTLSGVPRGNIPQILRDLADEDAITISPGTRRLASLLTLTAGHQPHRPHLSMQTKLPEPRWSPHTTTVVAPHDHPVVVPHDPQVGRLQEPSSRKTTSPITPHALQACRTIGLPESAYHHTWANQLTRIRNDHPDITDSRWAEILSSAATATRAAHPHSPGAYWVSCVKNTCTESPTTLPAEDPDPYGYTTSAYAHLYR